MDVKFSSTVTSKEMNYIHFIKRTILCANFPSTTTIGYMNSAFIKGTLLFFGCGTIGSGLGLGSSAMSSRALLYRRPYRAERY